MRKKIFSIGLFCSIPWFGYSLSASDSSAKDTSDKSAINLNLEYGSNYTYRLHKNDTSHSIPYLYPSLTYNAHSGFWVSAAFFRTFGDKGYSAYPQTDFSAGWDFNMKRDVSAAGISYTRSIYDRKNPMLQFALPNYWDGYFSYYFADLKTVFLGDYASGSFSSKTNAIKGRNNRSTLNISDYFLSLQLSYTYGWDDLLKDGDETDIGAMAQAMGGTDNFYSQALEQSAVSGKKGRLARKVISSAVSDQYAQAAAKFHVMEYQLQINAAYAVGKFTFSPDWTYVIPVKVIENDEITPSPYPLYHLNLTYTFELRAKGEETGKEK